MEIYLRRLGPYVGTHSSTTWSPDITEGLWRHVTVTVIQTTPLSSKVGTPDSLFHKH